MELNKIEKGEYLSEISHYCSNDTSDLKSSLKSISLRQLNSEGKNVNISTGYIRDYCSSASQYDNTIKVGKEDKYWTKKQVEDWVVKYYDENGDPSQDIHQFLQEAPRVGDLRIKGIRSVFQDIRDKTAFTVVFQKVDKKKTKKQYNAEIEEKVQQFMEPVLKAKKSKKSMEEAARTAVKDLIDNPVLDFIPGEMRTMICYKLQFSSRDGHYQVFDLEAGETKQVNIKTIQSIIYDGTKYELE